MHHLSLFPALLLLAGLPTLAGCGTDEPAASSADRSARPYVFPRDPLVDTPFAPLPLGAVRPEGWLHEQLRRMADGLTGHLDERYPTVGASNAWLGGDGDSWERGPYWLDGLVPLAYLLDDTTLIAKTRPWIEWALASQREDGFFGPAPSEDGLPSTFQQQRAHKSDWWPRMVVLKVLQQYHDATGDERVLGFMTRYFRYQLDHLPDQPLDHWTMWAKSRGGENQASVYWLYNRTGDAFLLELATLLFEQTLDWTGAFTDDWPDRSHAPTHVVNVGMGVKQPALQYLLTGEARYLEAVEQGLATLHEEHGQVQGMFAGDERLHGTSPTQGTELCAVVEFMYSLETLLWITGRVEVADLLERVAYNALPSHVTADFSARQYFQQVNQMRVSLGPRNFTNGFDHQGTDLCYGLLTGYPCCTTNMHQGWPKFTRHLWLAARDGGLAALVYAPSTVTARVGAGEGVDVQIREETDYPFEGVVTFTVSTGRPVAFPLHLRVPAWADGATIEATGGPAEPAPAGELATLARTWNDGDRIVLRLPMRVRTGRWHEHAVSVERGPLAFALAIEEDWRRRPMPSPGRYDAWAWEVHPLSPWNYGLLLDAEDPTRSFEVEQTAAPGYPWTPDAVPVRLRAQARRLPHWKEYNGSAGPLPFSPTRSDEPLETVTLIPYGATTLRIAAFPEVRE